MIRSERINVVPFEMKYLNHYFSGFNAEITKFQWPDPFESIEDARSTLQEFLNEMDREETLLFSILSKNDEFLGSVEIHGLAEDCPELGIWIIESEQNKGYAYEALNAVLDYVRSKYDKAKFYYEADLRNVESIKLLHKFDEKYEIIEQGLERLTTDSGKELELQGYILRTS
ncbi:MAG: GNAT family N-acetyltransferase [Lachnospiraceae bacterium]|nr:GNAT family N-acetyltransferase [Lachnospiraceae bacterium]